jgi:hypothetical protein
MEKRGPGQPTKCTPEAKKMMLYAISKGAPYQLACDYAGVHITTFLNWKAKAEEEKIPSYVEFFKELKQTQGATAIHWLEKIDEAMEDGTWTAAAWKLERRQGRYFAPQSAIIDANERIDKLEEGAQSAKRKGSIKGHETNEGSGEVKDDVS